MKPIEWKRWVLKTPHPTSEDIKKVSDYWRKTAGWIYAAKVGHSDTKWKVGETGRKSPFLRVNELQAAVSATEPFKLYWAAPVIQRHVAEKNAHHKLSTQYGVHLEKEFFETDELSIKKVFAQIVKEEQIDWAGWVTKPHEFDPQDWMAHQGLAVFDWESWWAEAGSSYESSFVS